MGSLGPGAHEVLFQPSKCLWWVWDSILDAILPLLPSLCFSFDLGHRVSFLVGSNILLLMVVQQLLAILDFSQEKMKAHPSTPPYFWRCYLHSAVCNLCYLLFLLFAFK